MQPMILDTSLSKVIYVSERLLHSTEFKPEEKLFLMEIINIQRKGQIPYLSQTQFAERNNKSRPTINKMVKRMVEKGYMINLKQKEESLACEYIVDIDLMKDLGYLLVSEAKEEKQEIISNIEIKQPTLEVEVKESEFSIDDIVNQCYEFLGCDRPPLKEFIRNKLNKDKFYKVTKGMETKTFTIPGYKGEL